MPQAVAVSLQFVGSTGFSVFVVDENDLLGEGPDILRAAARRCTPLARALELWNDVRFDYASTDAPDGV